MDSVLEKLLQSPDGLSALRQLGITSDGETSDILFGHSIELYCEDGSTVEKRKLLVDLLVDYARELGGKITHFHPHESSRLKKIASSDWAAYYSRLAETMKPDSDDAFDATLYGFVGGEDEDTATPYFCCAVGSHVYTRYSDVCAYFPIDWFNGNDKFLNYINLMKRWCSLIKVAHGTAGFSIILEEGINKSNGTLLAYPFLKRFPGLDLPNSTRWKTNVRNASRRHIRSINWLTAIDLGFVEELGGMKHITEALGEHCPIHVYDGGIIIQAGPRPEIGDLNRGLIPAHYKTVAKVLKPLRREEFLPKLPYLPAPQPLDSLEETLKWIRRFD